MSHSALEELESAETAIMSWISASSQDPEVDAMPMLLAVLRAVSRAAGLLQAESAFLLLPAPPNPEWRCWRGYPPYCSSLDPFAHEAGYGCGLGRPTAEKQT